MKKKKKKQQIQSGRWELQALAGTLDHHQLKLITRGNQMHQNIHPNQNWYACSTHFRPTQHNQL